MNSASVRITFLAAELGVTVYDIVLACGRTGIVGDGLRVTPEEAEVLRAAVYETEAADQPDATPPSEMVAAVDLRGEDRPAVVVIPGPAVPWRTKYPRRRLTLVPGRR